MHYQWMYVFIFLSVIILAVLLRQEYKRRMEKRTDLQKAEISWWRLEDNSVTRNSELHQKIGEVLDELLLAELEESLRVMRVTNHLISFRGGLSDEDRNNRRKSQNTLTYIFRSWYDHRPKIRKFFDDRRGRRSIRLIYATFKRTD